MKPLRRLLWIGATLVLFGFPARALDFTWSYLNNDGDPSTGGITSGTISGLVEGSNAIGSAGIALTVQQSVNLPAATPFTFLRDQPSTPARST